MLQQIQQLVAAAMQGDQQANQQIEQIMQAAQSGDQQAMQLAQVIQQVAQQMQGGQNPNAATYAKFGAKLEYIKQLNGICPEGYEMQMFKAGGRVCKKCIKKKEGGEVAHESKKSIGEDFKTQMAKCGGKAKKPKKEDGGEIIPKAEGGANTDNFVEPSRKATRTVSRFTGENKNLIAENDSAVYNPDGSFIIKGNNQIWAGNPKEGSVVVNSSDPQYKSYENSFRNNWNGTGMLEHLYRRFNPPTEMIGTYYPSITNRHL